MFWFGFATMVPAMLIGLGALSGGIWPVVGLLSITCAVFFMDKVIAIDLPEERHRDGLGLSLALGLVHLGLLPVVVWGVSLGPSPEGGLDLVDKAIVILGAGFWFGQISNSNAHELIHRHARLPRRLGRLLYGSVFNGHHASAHLRVHHVHAATEKDPNSARLGEGFWRFAVRCVAGEFRAGLRAESRAQQAAGRPWIRHPHVQDALVSGGTCALAFVLGGWAGVGALLGVAIIAAWQLMLSDYVQHYGLRRLRDAQGRLEPMGPQHSWNAPRWYSSAMMLNAPRHSDHHVNPTRPYPALEHDWRTMPVLPHSLPVMAVLALVPPVWHRLMDHRVLSWHYRNTGEPPQIHDSGMQDVVLPDLQT